MIAGTVTSGFMFSGCLTDGESETTGLQPVAPTPGYGRTPEEASRDREIMSGHFFNQHEMATITVLADLIIPKDEHSGSASEAGVPDFIEFIVKDIPSYQLPLRGGLMWIDQESRKRFNLDFKDLEAARQKEILDDIAYPDEVKPEFTHGARFFSNLRNLVATGFFTSKMGIEDLGYVGNTPNVWDGVPEDVLKAHGLAYDEKILKQSIKPEERNQIMDWEGYDL